jgi:hypothetical protein
MLALMGLPPLFHGHLKIREDEYEDDYIAYFFNELLVHRLLNPLGFAAGQLAVFQGASEAPLSES